MKKLKVLIIVLGCFFSGFAQKSTYEPAFWRPMSVGGSIELLGSYVAYNTESYLMANKEENLFFSGKIDLNTQSYFWHPNFLVLDVGATYNPGAGKDHSILMPDYAIENISKQLRVRTTLFRNKSINYSAFLNYINSYSNLENLSEISDNSFQWGGEFNYRNKLLPIKVNYVNFKKEQEQINLKRTYKDHGIELDMSTNASFSAFDSHDFKFSQRNYNNALVGFYENNVNTTTINLRDQFYFDKRKKKYLMSTINNLKNTGMVSYNRFNILENIFFTLPSNFKFSGKFDYGDVDQNNQNLKSQIISGELQHQLYESLSTQLSYQSIQTKHSVFNEKSNLANVGFSYTKKLPLNGRINLAYYYAQNKFERNSQTIEIPVYNEPYVLKDTEITLIQHPNILQESIVVKDFSGALIYQENIDYVLIKRDAFIEIQRLPGGLISNNQQVYIDFIATDLGDYNYTLLSNRFESSLSLFNNLIALYYKYYNKDYKNATVTNSNTLTYVDQKIIGIKLHYKILEIGAEKDQYNSNIIPYKLNSYFANFNGRLNDKISFAINGLVRDFEMIGEEGRSEKFIDASGNITYNLNYKTQLLITAGYRKQEGEGIDLDLFTSKAALSTNIRKLTIKLSADLYRRNYQLTDNYNFNGINLKITRNF